MLNSLLRFSDQVQASMSACILLSSVMTLKTVEGYEIEIGSDSNTKTVIRSAIDGSTLVTVPSDGVLKSDDLAYYWISWNNGYIEVGVNRYVLCYLISSRFLFQALKITSPPFKGLTNFTIVWNRSSSRHQSDFGLEGSGPYFCTRSFIYKQGGCTCRLANIYHSR